MVFNKTYDLWLLKFPIYLPITYCILLFSFPKYEYFIAFFTLAFLAELGLMINIKIPKNLLTLIQKFYLGLMIKILIFCLQYPFLFLMGFIMKSFLIEKIENLRRKFFLLNYFKCFHLPKLEKEVFLS